MTLFLATSMYALWTFVFILSAYKHQITATNDMPKGTEPFYLSDKFIVTCSLISAFLVGFGAGPLWVSQNCYMAECTSNFNKGRFTSLFFGFYRLGTIFGNLIAGALI